MDAAELEKFSKRYKELSEVKRNLEVAKQLLRESGFADPDNAIRERSMFVTLKHYGPGKPQSKKEKSHKIIRID